MALITHRFDSAHLLGPYLPVPYRFAGTAVTPDGVKALMTPMIIVFFNACRPVFAHMPHRRKVSRSAGRGLHLRHSHTFHAEYTVSYIRLHMNVYGLIPLRLTSPLDPLS